MNEMTKGGWVQPRVEFSTPATVTLRPEDMALLQDALRTLLMNTMPLDRKCKAVEDLMCRFDMMIARENVRQRL